MNRIVLISGIVASISIFNIAICDGQPCPSTKDHCFMYQNGSPTCVTDVLNGTGSTWNEMQHVCQSKGGRLVWLSNNLTLTNGVITHSAPGSLIVLGLLSSTVDRVGLFWKSPDNTSYQCSSTETSECLSSSNKDNCSAVGCCWRNNTCQYPNTQHLSVFNQSVENYNLSTNDSDHRQCVGYQLNNNSTKQGHWINYDCFKTLSNASYFCEYKCNTDQWKNTTITEFTFMEKNNNTNNITSTEKPNVNSTNSTSTSKTPLTETSKQNGTNSNSTSKPSTIEKPDKNGTTLGSTPKTPSAETSKQNGTISNSTSKIPTSQKPKENGTYVENTSNKTPTEKPKENGMNLESTSSRLINMLLVLILMTVVM